MSLISEGLKKAQIEAMRQDRAQRRTYFTTADPRPSRGRDPHLAFMVAIALASALLAAGAVVWLRRPPGAPVAPTERTAPKIAQMRPAPPPLPAPVAKRTSPPLAPSRVQPVKKVSAELPRKDDKPVRNRRDGFVEGQTYASPISSPFGREPLALAGIIGAGDQRMAIINGSTVRPGSMIGPFVVETIEPRRVQLRYIDVHFFVTP